LCGSLSKERPKMKCPKCQIENPETRKFCKECGAKLILVCPHCHFENLPSDKFCGECGKSLAPAGKELTTSEPEGERKYVTAMFSDLSGYTAISEKLDPEELKQIMSRIFGEIAQVVTKYEGFIEKFVGDAVIAFFGVPKAHEDDPIRAVRVAREIHELIDAISPEVEKRTGKSISMHTGINTGLVVTGEVSTEKGTHGLAGDPINVASRLSGLAKAGEILVGHDTYRQAEGYYTFEALEPMAIKGKDEPVQAYRVISPKVKPTTIHRLSGLRSLLIGRKVELDALKEAVENLPKGKGRIFSICGDAGTGKSRLIEEFKNTLNLYEIQWLEGHAYAYSQNIPYFPLIDLLNRVFHIEEGDPQGKVKEKIECGIRQLIGRSEDIIPIVGSLYSLHYPELEDVSPEFWRSRLQEVIQIIFSALAKHTPTVFFLEDLHWADPSFIDLLRQALFHIQQPAVVLCVYRPTFSLFTTQQLSGLGKLYEEIRLQDLSLSEAQAMLESLLKTETIPSDLKRFVRDKAEGNPFYLEELVNSLIESETLLRDNGSWKITRPITESDISSTINGLIAGRLDRLEKGTKRILQEASVIGRAFLYEILKRATELGDRIDPGLNALERLDLIRTRTIQPDLEYMFKHPLTQEVVYNGLLKKERQAVHERIALVMEELFCERLSEFYETLAFHFKRGQSLHKAVDYLMKSGEKSLKRYAVEESHQYYQEAFDLLKDKPGMTDEEKRLLIDLLNKWALVFYYRGDFNGLVSLLRDHEGLAESLTSRAILGMFYGWLGFSLHNNGKAKGSYECLCKALKIGEEIEDQRLIGYACAWLTWTCAGLGRLEEAVVFGQRAQQISRSFESDQYLYFKSLGGLGYTYYQSGETRKVLEASKALLDYGERHSNIRSLVMGHAIMGGGYALRGDYHSAIECLESGTRIAVDPFYSQLSRLNLGASYLISNQLDKAETALEEVLTYSQNFGAGSIGIPACIFMGVLLIAKGQMSQGLKLLEEGQRDCLENQWRTVYAWSEYALGKVYSQIAEGSGPISLLTMTKNIGFLIKNVPFASKKAEEHFNRAIEVAKEIGAKGTMGMAYLDLGLLYRMKGKTEQARKCVSEAIQIFEKTEAEGFLKQSREALASIEEGR
jgi:class 3 adenylate cyclase/tetratricopeptide (TPR) repeat protein